MKKALLVGINDYKYPIPKLRGCLNDVHTMWFILTQIFNFHPDNIRVLCDERATFDNIHDELIWLLKDGEELVFHFSGHGSQTRDLNQDESDGLEELIVVYDHSWDKPFVDDHLAAIFKNLKPEQNLTVLLDCCHSGSGTRMSNIQTVDRYLEPPLDIQLRYLGRDLKRNRLGVKQDEKGNVVDMNHVLISGCAENETSADAYIEFQYRGAFTYAFMKAVQNNPKRTVNQIHSELSQILKKSNFQQNPQLEGRQDLISRTIFGGP
jgi:hypothetical protein